MILWCDGAHDAAENMRRDAALLARAAAGGEPVLRLFTFAPPGITLGLNQVPARELDLAACRRDGVGWAVRPTGGRAILHDEEWTYALAAPLGDPRFGGARAAAYGRIHALILASLVRLGVPAEAVSRDGAGEAPRRAGGPAAPCFASSVRDEIVVGGGKLVGSAQRRTARALLQQGSVLLGEGHLRLADYLALPDGRRAAARAALRAASATAGRWLGARPPLAGWAEALAREAGPPLVLREGAAGAFLLTAAEGPSYTAARSN